MEDLEWIAVLFGKECQFLLPFLYVLISMIHFILIFSIPQELSPNFPTVLLITDNADARQAYGRPETTWFARYDWGQLRMKPVDNKVVDFSYLFDFCSVFQVRLQTSIVCCIVEIPLKVE